MKEIIGFLACLAAVVVILDPTTAKVDRRYRTGYKNNQVPVSTPWGSRLRRAGFLAGVAFLCFAAPSMLTALVGGVVALAGLVATWHFYPQFWSRYQRNGTSNAKFLAARTSMSLAIGGLSGYVALQVASSLWTANGTAAVRPATTSAAVPARSISAAPALPSQSQRSAPLPAPESAPQPPVDAVAKSSAIPAMAPTQAPPAPVRGGAAAKVVSSEGDEVAIDDEESSSRLAEGPRRLVGPGERRLPGVRPRSEIPFPPAYARGTLRSNGSTSTYESNRRDQPDVGPMGEGP